MTAWVLYKVTESTNLQKPCKHKNHCVNLGQYPTAGTRILPCLVLDRKIFPTDPLP